MVRRSFFHAASRLVLEYITHSGSKGLSNLTYYTWAQVFPRFLAQSRPFHIQYCRTTPGRESKKLMTMAFLLCTNVVAVHTLTCCGRRLHTMQAWVTIIVPQCFVHHQLTADSVEIDELERFWALTWGFRRISRAKLVWLREPFHLGLHTRYIVVCRWRTYHNMWPSTRKPTILRRKWFLS